jgi:2-polyprenyl-3-methyl-5-hydroxy-6-metoxy-1,4-benzoquinol methylase
MSDKERWQARYNTPDRVYSDKPAEFLRTNIHLLPDNGLALDIAAGEGRNSVFLAQHGLEVIALDISEHALQKCMALAGGRGIRVNAAVVDLANFLIPKESFDVIVNFNYLQRSLARQIIEGLKPAGWLLFETLTIEHLKWSPNFNPEFLLDTGELTRIFGDLEIIEYSESTIPSGQSFRSVASLAARKRV